MILSTLGRLIVIGLSFIVAAFVAVIVLFALGSIWAGDVLYQEFAEGDPAFEDASGVLGFLVFTTTVAPALSAFPGVVAVIVGEVLRLRSWLYYVPAGGAALAAIPFLVAPDADTAPAAEYMTVFASAGFAAGLVYWLLAGRGA